MAMIDFRNMTREQLLEKYDQYQLLARQQDQQIKDQSEHHFFSDVMHDIEKTMHKIGHFFQRMFGGHHHHHHHHRRSHSTANTSSDTPPTPPAENITPPVDHNPFNTGSPIGTNPDGGLTGPDTFPQTPVTPTSGDTVDNPLSQVPRFQVTFEHAMQNTDNDIDIINPNDVIFVNHGTGLPYQSATHPNQFISSTNINEYTFIQSEPSLNGNAVPAELTAQEKQTIVNQINQADRQTYTNIAQTHGYHLTTNGGQQGQPLRFTFTNANGSPLTQDQSEQVHREYVQQFDTHANNVHNISHHPARVQINPVVKTLEQRLQTEEHLQTIHNQLSNTPQPRPIPGVGHRRDNDNDRNQLEQESSNNALRPKFA
ncbi:MAG: hypothetical protein Tsb005_02760 [Gammaproteobacteria bacterium]